MRSQSQQQCDRYLVLTEADSHNQHFLSKYQILFLLICLCPDTKAVVVIICEVVIEMLPKHSSLMGRDGESHSL